MTRDTPRPTPVPLVYHPSYRIRFFGIERLHPFDVRKLERIHDALIERGYALPESFRAGEPIGDSELAAIHDPGYLASLRQPEVLAAVLEVPVPRLLSGLIERRVLAPLRRAVSGTQLAATQALERGGLAVHLGGGFHHARPEGGHGFCPLNDVAWAVHSLRQSGWEGRALVIDTDAHQGDGNHACFEGDERVHCYSVHQQSAFPIPKVPGDLDDGLPDGAGDRELLELLERRLPELFAAAEPALVFHVAGADVLHDDPLTHLRCSVEGLCERDRLVARAALARQVPVVHLLAGGYGPSAARAQTRSIQGLLHLDARLR